MAAVYLNLYYCLETDDCRCSDRLFIACIHVFIYLLLFARLVLLLAVFKINLKQN